MALWYSQEILTVVIKKDSVYSVLIRVSTRFYFSVLELG